MKNEQKAQLKNKVLQFLLDRGPSSWGVDAIYDQMGKPTESTNHLLEILGEMTKEASLYFDFDPEEPPTHFAANDFTKRFLEEGAFVAEWKKHLEANRKMNDRAMRGNRIEELKEKELKQKIQNNKFSLPLSIASIIIALGALLWSILSPFNDDGLDNLNTKFKKVEKELKELRIEYKEKNKELEDKLYKADMLIGIYESDVEDRDE